MTHLTLDRPTMPSVEAMRAARKIFGMNCTTNEFAALIDAEFRQLRERVEMLVRALKVAQRHVGEMDGRPNPDCPECAIIAAALKAAAAKGVTT